MNKVLSTTKKKIRSVISFRDQIRSRYLIAGICWIIAGITRFTDSKVFGIIGLVFLLISIYFQVRVFIHKREEMDEMAEENINAAQAVAFNVAVIILLLFYIICGNILPDIFNVLIDLNEHIYPFITIFLGLLNLIVGAYFIVSEDAE